MQEQSVVVHGGLTGAVQGAVTTQDDVILSLERMNKIEALDPVSGTITVQAGVTLQTVQETAEASNYIFPLDIGSRGSCTIGGNIATNAGGVQVIRYGMMRALVLGLEVVLADGRILSSLDTVLKNNSGYDLKQLFIGSEGTLGVITRAVLRLAPRPGEQRTALVATESFDQLLDLLQHARRCLGTRLGSFEVMWRNYYEFAADAHDTPPPLPAGYDAYTIIEGLSSHESDSVVFDHTLEEAFESGLVVDGVIAKTGRERESFWNLRDSFMHIIAKYADIVDLDTSVPILQNPRLHRIDGDTTHGAISGAGATTAWSPRRRKSSPAYLRVQHHARDPGGSRKNILRTFTRFRRGCFSRTRNRNRASTIYPFIPVQPGN